MLGAFTIVKDKAALAVQAGTLAQFLPRSAAALPSRAMHDQAGLVEDAPRFAPVGKISQRIAANKEKERMLGVPASQLGQGIDRVAGAGAFFLQFVDLEGGLAGQGEPEHLHALVESGDGLPLLLRRPRARAGTEPGRAWPARALVPRG